MIGSRLQVHLEHPSKLWDRYQILCFGNMTEPLSQLLYSSETMLRGLLIKQKVSGWCIIDQVLMGESSHQRFGQQTHTLNAFPLSALDRDDNLCTTRVLQKTLARIVLWQPPLTFNQANDDLVNPAPIRPGGGSGKHRPCWGLTLTLLISLLQMQTPCSLPSEQSLCFCCDMHGSGLDKCLSTVQRRGAGVMS